MATPPTTNQTFKIVGTLDIVGNEDVTSPTFSSQGLIRMSRADGTPLGSIRGIADPTYRGLVVETAGMPAGYSVRTRLNQGPSSIGGIGDKYVLNCVSNVTTTQFLNCVADKTYNGVNQNYGQPVITAERYSTEDSSNAGGSSPIARFIQTTHKEDENVVIHLGARTKTVMGALGYNMFSNSLTDRLWLGFTSPSSQTTVPIKCILMDILGNVEIPKKVTATTISATTYLNLPPVPASQLLPLTLATNKVGINNTHPNVALDVTGDVSASGKVHADTVEATHWIGLPQTDLTPITLDPVNQRVGINTTTPDDSLHVVGDCHVTNQVQCAQILCQDGTFTSIGTTAVDTNALNVTDAARLFGSLSVGPNGDEFVVSPTNHSTSVSENLYVGLNKIHLDGVNGLIDLKNATILTGTGSPEGVNSAIVGSLYMRQDGTPNNTLYVKSTGIGNTGWVAIGSVGPNDLLPITLNKTTNRVGINQLIPAYPLHVTGDIYTSTAAIVNGLQVLGGSGTPEGVKTAPVGSLYMRSDGASGTTLYTKETGTGTTGWAVVGGGGASQNFTHFTTTAQFINANDGTINNAWSKTILTFTPTKSGWTTVACRLNTAYDSTIDAGMDGNDSLVLAVSQTTNNVIDDDTTTFSSRINSYSYPYLNSTPDGGWSIYVASIPCNLTAGVTHYLNMWWRRSDTLSGSVTLNKVRIVYTL